MNKVQIKPSREKSWQGWGRRAAEIWDNLCQTRKSTEESRQIAKPADRPSVKILRRIERLVDEELITSLVNERTELIDDKILRINKYFHWSDRLLINEFKVKELELIRDEVKKLTEECFYLTAGQSLIDEIPETIDKMAQWIYFFNRPENQPKYNGQLEKDLKRWEKRKKSNENIFDKRKNRVDIALTGIKSAQRLSIKQLVKEIRDYVNFNDELPRLYFMAQLEEYCRQKDIDPEKIIAEVIINYWSTRGVDWLKNKWSLVDKKFYRFGLNQQKAKQESWVVYYQNAAGREVRRQVYGKFDWLGRFREIFPWEV